MASFASSETFVAVAWAAGIGSLSLAAALSVQVLRLRWRAARRARRRAEFLAAWRPLLYEAALGGEPALPPLDGDDDETFAVLWNDLQDVLHPESRAPLNRVAEQVRADAAARLRLRYGHPSARVQALRMIGHLGRREDYQRVRDLLDDPRAYLSLSAARALVRIDPVGAPADVLPRMAARSDWPAALLVTALAGANRRALGEALRAACAEAPPEELVRLLGLVELVDAETAGGILRRSFAAAADAEVVAAVLRHVHAPDLLDLARAACTHSEWAVRTQAASALGRAGEPEDRERLLALLRDPQWWVRYRAAQALASGRFGSRLDVAALVAGIGDRYAADALAQALAERGA